MFYFIFVIIVFILIFIMREDKRKADKFLIVSLAAFMLDIAAMILYTSKDVYYYNVLNHYFSFPESVWRVMMYSSIPRSFLIRGMNFFSLMYMYFSFRFAQTFMSDFYKNSRDYAKRILLVVFAIMFVIFDPGIDTRLYMIFCGKYLTPVQIEQLSGIVIICSRIICIGIVIYGMIKVFISNLRVSKMNFFKGYSMLECLCYLSVSIAYLFIFWFAPTVLVDVSKLSGYVNFRQVPLSQGNAFIYRIFPYYLFFASIFLLFVTINYIRLQRKWDDNKLEISRQIDASETTSKAFCHYLKNEILALQSGLEMLEVGDESKDSKKELMEECDYLYGRLDEIHRSTKMSELTLRRCSLPEPMDMITLHMASCLSTCSIEKSYAESLPDIMADASYFEQAIHNILSNAAEAMQSNDKSSNIIKIEIRSIDNSLQLSISDNGKGIAQRDLDKIFNPFVSSQSIKKHWGIGLSLTYKIISAHGGGISVSSVEKEGTTFVISMPAVGANISMGENTGWTR